MGTLEVIIGPMFSSKSSTLLSRLSTHAVVGQKVLYINHVKDSRSDQNFSTHAECLSKKEGDYNMSFIKADFLRSIPLGEIQRYSVIGCDEAQFFEDLVPYILTYVESLGKTVIVAGLDGDVERQPLGGVLNLIRYCDKVTKLTALCKQCAGESQVRPALFNYRFTAETGSVVIGGADKYEALCRECYLKRRVPPFW